MNKFILHSANGMQNKFILLLFFNSPDRESLARSWNISRWYAVLKEGSGDRLISRRITFKSESSMKSAPKNSNVFGRFL